MNPHWCQGDQSGWFIPTASIVTRINNVTEISVRMLVTESGLHFCIKQSLLQIKIQSLCGDTGDPHVYIAHYDLHNVFNVYIFCAVYSYTSWWDHITSDDVTKFPYIYFWNVCEFKNSTSSKMTMCSNGDHYWYPCIQNAIV